MSNTEHIYNIICRGNEEALDFLRLWNRYCHDIDDLIDETIDPDPERILALLAKAALLYGHSFWVKNAAVLVPIVQQITSDYAESVAWERANEPWKAQWADHLRFAGNMMVETVGRIVGGYEHVRKYSGALRSLAYAEHHDKEGKPQ